MEKKPERRINAVKLISGLLSPEDGDLLRWAAERMTSAFGDIERESPPYPFDCTDYYRDISPSLTRRFFTFAGLRHPFELAAWKKLAISIEAESARGRTCRSVNIDPGYIDGARLVLASTKDNAHRIYIRDDIYAEVTLCHRKSGWESFSYTFPDFASGRYDAFLDTARGDWRAEMRVLRENTAVIDHERKDCSL
ncbi:MAG: DUF4416 family protein [Synergistaceae bacterium]|jgi:hypothetical protein|nr:DUF4416 family protein [Synergistaceae bacterium]